MKEVTYKDWQKNPTPREMWGMGRLRRRQEKDESLIYF